MDSAEHQKIAETLTLHFAEGDRTADTSTVLHGSSRGDHNQPITPLELSYGQVISLGGDFYGMPNFESIAEGARDDSGEPWGRFWSAFLTLDHCDRAELAKILATMSTEVTGLANATRPTSGPKDPSTMYAALGDSLSIEWNKETGGGITTPTPLNAAIAYLFSGVLKPLLLLWNLKLPMPRGRYMMLATNNWDHFGADAVMSYRIGHAFACYSAANAKLDFGSAPAAAQKRLALERAYMVNAFADHFLTDLFSAGHLRVPRKQLQGIALTTGGGIWDTATSYILGAIPLNTFIGGMLAKSMHDEDGLSGLAVRNARNDQWTAYGDSFLFDRLSSRNLGYVREAVQISINEVWDAYNNPMEYIHNPGYAESPCPMGALNVTPDLDDVNQTKSTKNPAPLFILNGPTIERRVDVSDRTNHNYGATWYSLPTLAALGIDSVFPR